MAWRLKLSSTFVNGHMRTWRKATPTRSSSHNVSVDVRIVALNSLDLGVVENAKKALSPPDDDLVLRPKRCDFCDK